MTKKDFFRIIIKLFGLYAGVITLFNVVPTSISNLAIYDESILIIFIIGMVALILFLYSLLIFRTDRIIKFLKLDKGFDDDDLKIDFLTNGSVVKVALVILGLYLMVAYIPDFFLNTFYAFKGSMDSQTNDGFNFYENQIANYFNWAISAINIAVGYLITTNYALISNWILKGEKKNIG